MTNKIIKNRYNALLFAFTVVVFSINFVIVITCEFIVRNAKTTMSFLSEEFIFVFIAIILVSAVVSILIKVEMMLGLRAEFWSARGSKEDWPTVGFRVFKFWMILWALFVTLFPLFLAKFSYEHFGWETERLIYGLFVVIFVGVRTQNIWRRYMQMRLSHNSSEVE